MLKKIILFLFFACLFAFAQSEEFSLQATVTVNPMPIALDVNVAVLTKAVEQGNNLLFFIELSKQTAEEISVDLKYEVLKKSMGKEEVIATKTDSMLLVDYASKQAAIQVPLSTNPGKYELRVTASYFNQSDVDKDSFFVKKAKPTNFLHAIFSLFQLAYLTKFK